MKETKDMRQINTQVTVTIDFPGFHSSEPFMDEETKINHDKIHEKYCEEYVTENILKEYIDLFKDRIKVVSVKTTLIKEQT